MRKEFNTKEERATYQCWLDMKARCYRTTSQRYYTHGARGITVCDKWKWSFDNFLKDMGVKPAGYTLERIDNDGNYELSNCKWATPKEQAYNRRTNRIYNGKNIREWSDIMGISFQAMSRRLVKWPLEKALSLPKQQGKRINESQ